MEKPIESHASDLPGTLPPLKAAQPRASLPTPPSSTYPASHLAESLHHPELLAMLTRGLFLRTLYTVRGSKRHFLLVRHGQYEDGEKASEKRVSVALV